ncbi:hypothetical protein PT974_08083 [Cladobotryum mycophilum]|uniref:Fungal-specific transcription factor domain-containing protein n=1 Tax=Cladobotryum mycophilum TaxID=491253 RepID=A0ABR0SDB5_9HYPO
MVYEPQENLSESHRAYGRHFLNVTMHDVVSFVQSKSCTALVRRPVISSARTLTLYPTMIGQDAFFMSYYESVIAPMISTTQVRNGFRTELIRMILSRGDTAIQALWNSMMAVAAFHHGGSAAALKYNTKALRYLSDSLKPGQGVSVIELNEAHFATCMMLCIYSVFDETDGHWPAHLDGAKHMLQKLYPDHKKSVNADFLFTWFLYHEVLACFSQPLRQANNCIDVLLLLKTSSCDATVILGALGCSLEALAIIHRVNKFRIALIRNEFGQKSPELLLRRVRLEHTLHYLVQRLDSDEEAGEVPERHTSILKMAELYRIGTLLYLMSIVPLPRDDARRANHLDEAFRILENLGVPANPWPVFMIACECHTDERRIKIMKVMELMSARNIGSNRVMQALIESCWKNHDLQADSGLPHRVTWWEFVNSYETTVPWFM